MSGGRLQPGELRNVQQIASNADRTQVPVGLGPAQVNPSQPGGNPINRVALPGVDYPNEGSIPVDKIGEADITNGAANVKVIQTIKVPDNRTFRVAGIGFGAEDESALRFLSWTVNVNPPLAPYYGYVNMPAAIGSIAYPADVFIVVGSSVTFTVVAQNNAPATVTYHYFVRVRGWFYQEAGQ